MSYISYLCKLVHAHSNSHSSGKTFVTIPPDQSHGHKCRSWGGASEVHISVFGIFQIRTLNITCMAQKLSHSGLMGFGPTSSGISGSELTTGSLCCVRSHHTINPTNKFFVSLNCFFFTWYAHPECKYLSIWVMGWTTLLCSQRGKQLISGLGEQNPPCNKS